MADRDYITFGPVHLEVRDPERTARFWETLFGFTRRPGAEDSIEIGTADETLLVLHGGARTPFRKGHSGIYHIAIHPPDARDFARLFKRLADSRIPSRRRTTRFRRRFIWTTPTASTWR